MATAWLDERELRWTPGVTERTLVVRRGVRRRRRGLAALALVLLAVLTAGMLAPGRRAVPRRAPAFVPLAAVLPATPGAQQALLHRIALCESGDDPRALYDGGRYRGAYQFDLATWHSVGGSGDPAAASPAVQRAMAARLLERRGRTPWPNCARR